MSTVMTDVLEGKDPEQRTAEFCTRAELRVRWNDVATKVKRARIQADARPKDQAAAAELDAAEQEQADLREQVKGSLLRFTFHPVEREAFDALKGLHRPTDKQRAEARKLGNQPPEWNIDTFAPALVAAACVKLEGPSGEQPGLEPEDALAIWNSKRWNESERNDLFNTALSAYLSRTVMDGATLGND